MKKLVLAFAFLFAAPLLNAEEYLFQYHRFGHIALKTTREKGRIVVLTYSKTPGYEQTLFASQLTLSSAGNYVTPKGSVFTLKQLSKPIINDGNRHINSGDWQLTVSGHGAEFARLKSKMPVVAFGATPPLVYLGSKVK